jgi:hypothetical protein
MEKPIADINSKKRRNYKFILWVAYFAGVTFVIFSVNWWKLDSDSWEFWAAPFTLFAIISVIYYVIDWQINRRYPKKLAPAEIKKL